MKKQCKFFLPLLTPQKRWTILFSSENDRFFRLTNPTGQIARHVCWLSYTGYQSSTNGEEILDGGAGRGRGERVSALSLFRFHLSLSPQKRLPSFPFPPETPATQARSVQIDADLPLTRAQGLFI